MSGSEPGIAGISLAHYQIIGPLGEGGMGRVFLAEDTRLERRVAIKMLPPELALDRQWRKRFVREARLLAALDHPGIVTVYSVESFELPADDRAGREPARLARTLELGAGTHHFFTMELVEGERLDRVIPAGGLPVARFFELAASLVEALAAAHARGVVHRDLKPANVMVTAEGRVKVLDFGLAQAGGTEPASGDARTAEQLTLAGALLGTLPYMAPEQLVGRPADRRTDVFALGLVLFEMASGSRPFAAASTPELISAVLRDEPRRLGEVRSGFPAGLDRLLARCLSRDPSRRPPTALDLRRELEELSGQVAAGDDGVRSIAVLAFADMSEQQDQDYFCEGIAEELINALNRVAGLRVVSRAASFQFRGTGLDLAEIGRRLKVDAILEGSVRKAGNRLRITAELVGVDDGYDLWSDSFDRQLEDVFEIQGEIARAIVGALAITLSAEQRRRLGRPGTTAADAYESYLRGRAYFYRYTCRAMEFALQLFRQAIARDRRFARAYAGIADCHSYLYANAERIDEHLAGALAASRLALDIDPELAEGHVALAVALSYGDRPEEAGESFRRAIQLDPRLFEAEYFFARHCFARGRTAEAVDHYARAEALRPEDYQSPLLAAQSLEALGRHSEADEARQRGVRLAEESMRLRPDDTRALYMAANALVVLGERERGVRWARRAQRLEPDEPMVLYNLACIYSLAGEIEDALDCLEACLGHGFTYRDWAEHDGNLDAIREHPRYRALMAEPAVPG